MIKILVSVLTLYNSETNMYRTTVTMVESTMEQCERRTLMAGQTIIRTMGGYDKVMVKCVPIESL